ncbi:bifunctional folylpolyglutamate synthase/dihydrofolate synthase [Bacillus sp. FJAT-45350]|uniref:bifunctional folylpolyglutamate synthase/dihydrofolate synthase n=1 Tax=Bacillus sp. FJAT-45350 TaxID=2011014 RepID=UPI0015CAF54F|nr:folylpolyglutamate synthase/dihydrofolate synthase family protein [Bacillus sp. FJAT-45350]
MFQDINEVHSYIEKRKEAGIQLGLDRMKNLLEFLGHPQKEVRAIHLAGTNGKGSTINFLREILLKCDVSVGAFTSPPILGITDQIWVNDEAISDDGFVEAMNQFAPKVEEFEEKGNELVTEFEFMTAFAFYYFAEVNPVDFLLLETGLGGREDATNLCTPILSLITNVSFDHMQILGRTIEEIAIAKAGIIKQGIPIITTEETKEALAIFENEANEKGSGFYSLGENFQIKNVLVANDVQTFSFLGPYFETKEIELTMKGVHQIKNASLAIMAVSYLKEKQLINVDEAKLKEGLKKAQWRGRMETVNTEPLVILDGAHNEGGTHALAQALEKHYPDKKIHVIFAATKEKDVESLLKPIYPLVEQVCFTSFQFPRAAKSSEMFNQSSFENKIDEDNWKAAVKWKLATMQDSEMLVITGSLYFISEVRRFFSEKIVN